MITQTRVIYTIAHDSDEMLFDLQAFVEWVNSMCPNHDVHFESEKSHFGSVIVESAEGHRP